jgi:competence protein ComEC
MDDGGKIWHYNGQNIGFSGQVVQEPDIRASSQKLTIGKIVLDKRKLVGKILITVERYPKYKYGDDLDIFCELEAPEPFSGFAYDRYLALHDIYTVCYRPGIELKRHGQGNIVFTSIYKFKDYARRTFIKNLNAPHAALAIAMTLGDKQGIPQELRQVFARAGISHVIAISGMHIGIITALVLVIINQFALKRRLSYILSCGFLFLYIIMVGLPASAVRAGVMGFLVLTALHLGRLNQLKHSLMIAAALMLMINPFLLRDDIGWQLSFLAVLGIAYFYPIFEKGFRKIIPREIRRFRFVRAVLAVISITLASNLSTWPIVAYNFSIVSLVSPLVNLMVLWTLPFLFSLLGLGLALSFIPNLSFLIFKIAELILFYIVEVSEYFIKIPFAYREVFLFSFAPILIYYLFLISIFYIIKIK